MRGDALYDFKRNRRIFRPLGGFAGLGKFRREGYRLKSLRENYPLQIESSLVNSVHPTPPLPRWAATLKFVIPTEAEGPAVSLSATAKVLWANHLRHPFLYLRKLQIPPLRSG